MNPRFPSSGRITGYSSPTRFTDGPDRFPRRNSGKGKDWRRYVRNRKLEPSRSWKRDSG
jgi:hypothetical protein